MHISFDWQASVYYGGEFELLLTAGAEPIAEYSQIVTLTTGSASGHTDWYIGLLPDFEQATLDDLEISFTLAGSDNDWAIIKNLRVWLTHAVPTDLERNNRLANTKERDTSTGLDNHGFRYYDPDAGRYVTRDPIGYADGLNVYQSVHNNPINHVDPLGLREDDEMEDAKRWLRENPQAAKQMRSDYRGAQAAEANKAAGYDPKPGTIWTERLRAGAATQVNRAEEWALDNGYNRTAVGIGFAGGALGAGLEQGTDPTELALNLIPGGKGAKGGAKGMAAAGGVALDWIRRIKAGKKAASAAEDGVNAAVDARRAMRDTDLEELDPREMEYYGNPEGVTTGSYTAIFESGNKYHGKGPPERAISSAKREMKANNDKVVGLEWEQAPNTREALKD